MMFVVPLLLLTLLLVVMSFFVTLVIARSWYQLSHPTKDKDEWYVRANGIDRPL